MIGQPNERSFLANDRTFIIKVNVPNWVPCLNGGTIPLVSKAANAQMCYIVQVLLDLNPFIISCFMLTLML